MDLKLRNITMREPEQDDLVVLSEKSGQGKDQRKYQCERCPGMFSTVLSLKRHLGTHRILIKETAQNCKISVSDSSNTDTESTQEIMLPSLESSEVSSIIINSDAAVPMINFQPKGKKPNAKPKRLKQPGKKKRRKGKPRKSEPIPENAKQKRGRGRPRKLEPTPEKPPTKYFNCSSCEDYFYSEVALTFHIRKKHAELPYKCESCTKCFDTSHALIDHSKRHKRQHHCSYCSKAFFAKREFEDHIRVHTGEKPFSCEVCDKKFSSRGSFRYHLKTHTKPFKCETCSDSFACWQSLKNHSEKHKSQFLV